MTPEDQYNKVEQIGRLSAALTCYRTIMNMTLNDSSTADIYTYCVTMLNAIVKQVEALRLEIKGTPVNISSICENAFNVGEHARCNEQCDECFAQEVECKPENQC